MVLSSHCLWASPVKNQGATPLSIYYLCISLITLTYVLVLCAPDITMAEQYPSLASRKILNYVSESPPLGPEWAIQLIVVQRY